MRFAGPTLLATVVSAAAAAAVALFSASRLADAPVRGRLAGPDPLGSLASAGARGRAHRLLPPRRRHRGARDDGTYRDHLFTNNLFGHQMNHQVLVREGSAYEAKHAGFDHHIGKPYDPKALLVLLDEIATRPV